jgi:cytochrome oxidase Cu insertion factor (SCO1/SenC/PrrC family)
VKILAAVTAVVVMTAAAPALAAPDFASLQVQQYDPPRPAPEFSLPDLKGRNATLSGLRGKVVMLFFWATW